MTDYLHWCDFLDADLLTLARATTRDQRQHFTDTTVTTGEPDYRKSKVLWHYNYPTLYDQFTNRLRSFLPYIQQNFPQLSDDPAIELQLTATGNDEFFRRHTDNGCPRTNMRVVTFVYYYTLMPERGFRGGNLLLETAKGLFSIEPIPNSIILFPSGWWHEIAPVTVPSRLWEDSRFTLNGFINQAAGQPCQPGGG